MQPIKNILRFGKIGQENQETLKAAAILSIANKAIQNLLQFEPYDARANIFKNGDLYISVSHGAIAGKVKISEPQIIEKTNEAVIKMYPGTPGPVQRIITRLR